MTYFLIGIIAAALGFACGRYLKGPNTRPAEKNKTKAGSNSREAEEKERKKKDRQEWIEEHERQFFNMMNYTGEKQK